MLTRLKNIVLCLFYLFTLCIAYIYNCASPFGIHAYISFMVIYYMVLLHPRVHVQYVFLLSERTNPLWTYLYKILFHILLHIKSSKKALFTTVTWFLIILWKEIRFLIRHAEKRLGKIDAELYDAEKGIRVAHIRRNALEEDMENRFHLNLHETNRLYIMPLTNETEKDYRAIKNYKAERRNGKMPKLHNSWETRMWEASTDNTVFIANRKYTMSLPLLFILFTIGATGELDSPQSYTNIGLFTLEILTTLLGTPGANDLVLDTVYYLTSTIFMIMYAHATCDNQQ